MLCSVRWGVVAAHAPGHDVDGTQGNARQRCVKRSHTQARCGCRKAAVSMKRQVAFHDIHRRCCASLLTSLPRGMSTAGLVFRGVMRGGSLAPHWLTRKPAGRQAGRAEQQTPTGYGGSLQCTSLQCTLCVTNFFYLSTSDAKPPPP